MIKIYSHYNKDTSWISNYDNRGFWNTVPSTSWKTEQFVTKLRSITPRDNKKYEFIDYTPDADNGYYLIFYGGSAPLLEHHGMAFLTSEIVEKINQGRLKLLIALVHETFDSGVSMREWFWLFCAIITRVGIKRPHSVVFFTSTQSGAPLHEDNRCDFVYYPWFEMDLRATFTNHNIPCPIIDLSKKDRIFINLNLTLRQHRFLLVMYLYYRKLINYGYVSWRNPPTKCNWNEIVSGNGFEEWGLGYRGQLSSPSSAPFFYFVSTMKKIPNMVLDNYDFSKDGTLNATWIGADEYYHRAWVDLVSETHPELYGDTFLTEKTFKPMAHGMPFIFNATENHLKGIRNLGYQTFPELFDETYDTMPGSLNKIMKIGEELNLLCIDPNKQKILHSPEVQEKIKFNQDLFWNRDHHSAIANALTDAWLLGRA